MTPRPAVGPGRQQAQLDDQLGTASTNGVGPAEGTMSVMGPHLSPDSRRSLAAIDRTVLNSSQDAGWTSLLVDHHVVRPDEQFVEIPPTPDQTVVVGVRGAQQLEVVRNSRRRSAVFGAGTVGLTAGGQGVRLRRYRAMGFTTLEKVNIYIPAATLAGVGEHLGRAGSRSCGSLQTLAIREEAVATMAGALVGAIGRGLPDLYAEAAAQWLATHLLSIDFRQRRPINGRHHLTRGRLDGVLDLMRTAYAEPLSLERLAAEARVSKYHLSRLFREATGTTPHAYLIRIRLEAAARFLADTDLPVAQVARRCGYVRAAHFGAAFTRLHGVSPRAYRLQAQEPTHLLRDHGLPHPGSRAPRSRFCPGATSSRAEPGLLLPAAGDDGLAGAPSAVE